MSRSTATADARGKGAATLAAGVLLVMLGGYAWITLQPVPMAGPPVPGGPAVARGEAVANAWAVAPPPVPMATSQIPQAPVAAADLPAPVRTPSGPADMPYRFVGKSAAGAEPSVVLFGRGRVVTVHGPRALDDEYVVEAVFDDYLVVRHLPTGVGRFLPLAHRQQVVAPRQDPEDSPQD